MRRDLGERAPAREGFAPTGSRKSIDACRDQVRKSKFASMSLTKAFKALMD